MLRVACVARPTFALSFSHCEVDIGRGGKVAVEAVASVVGCLGALLEGMRRVDMGSSGVALLV
eukprot:713958-Alexandrium_andersonii.AAC.1